MDFLFFLLLAYFSYHLGYNRCMRRYAQMAWVLTKYKERIAALEAVVHELEKLVEKLK